MTIKIRAITQVDQPLCLECATRVREEMDAAVTEMEAECEAYEAALQNLAQEDATPMSEEVRADVCLVSCLGIWKMDTLSVGIGLTLHGGTSIYAHEPLTSTQACLEEADIAL